MVGIARKTTSRRMDATKRTLNSTRGNTEKINKRSSGLTAQTVTSQTWSVSQNTALKKVGIYNFGAGKIFTNTFKKFLCNINYISVALTSNRDFKAKRFQTLKN